MKRRDRYNYILKYGETPLNEDAGNHYDCVCFDKNGNEYELLKKYPMVFVDFLPNLNKLLVDNCENSLFIVDSCKIVK